MRSLVSQVVSISLEGQQVKDNSKSEANFRNATWKIGEKLLRNKKKLHLGCRKIHQGLTILQVTRRTALELGVKYADARKEWQKFEDNNKLLQADESVPESWALRYNATRKISFDIQTFIRQHNGQIIPLNQVITWTALETTNGDKTDEMKTIHEHIMETLEDMKNINTKSFKFWSALGVSTIGAISIVFAIWKILKGCAGGRTSYQNSTWVRSLLEEIQKNSVAAIEHQGVELENI